MFRVNLGVSVALDNLVSSSRRVLGALGKSVESHFFILVLALTLSGRESAGEVFASEYFARLV
jgi:hypothetical protein